MKARLILLLILLIVFTDQALKIYVKMHFNIGDCHSIIGSWFKLYFVENEGMAYELQFGGHLGKMLLTLFRLGCIVFGVWYLHTIISNKYHPGFITAVALVFSGALGNLIDSMFYGIIFEESTPYHISSIFPKRGYADFLYGNVVDMIYLPIINTRVPNWVPVWGGESFEFCRLIFNIADLAIFTGVITILVFQKTFFRRQENKRNILVQKQILEKD
jgi:signal peptidase II